MRMTSLDYMRLIVVVILGGLSVVGCDARSIEGKWTLDFDAFIKSNPLVQKQLEANPKTRAVMEARMASMSFVFGKDSVTATLGEKVILASYTIVSREGNTIVIESQSVGSSHVETITVTFTEADKISLTRGDNSPVLTLVRSD